MSDFISREAAIKLFNFAVLDCLGMEPTIRAGDIIKALESIPAADVRPVPEGGIGEMSDGYHADPLDAAPRAAEGGKMNGCEFCGYANRTAGKTLHIVEETEPRIFINMHGSGYIQIFDEDYPGFVDGFYVNYCPMCGSRLRSGYVGGEPRNAKEGE